MGTFLDIEGAFDNVSFKAISRALEKYCPSTSVNNWINTLIDSCGILTRFIDNVMCHCQVS